MTDDDLHECERVSLFLREDAPGGDVWAGIVARTCQAVAGNPAWAGIVPAWLAQAGTHRPFIRVEVAVKPGCDLMRCLAIGGPASAFLYLPSLRVELRTQPAGPSGTGSGQPPALQLLGRLEWSGSGRIPARERVRAVYPTPAAWVDARRTGAVAGTDRDLLASLGLVHTLVEETPEGEHRMLTLDSGGVLRRHAPVGRDPGGGPVWSDRQHIVSFTRGHRAELAEIAAEFAAASPSDG